MEIITIARTLFALLLVVFLIIIAVGLYNKFLQNNKYLTLFVRKKSLKISDMLVIDQHNKIVEIVREKKRYLMLIGKNSEILIESYEEKIDI